MADEGQHAEVLGRAERAIARSAEAMEHLAAAVALAAELAKSDGISIPRRRQEELDELVANLRRKIDSQQVIEQAKGILMLRSRMTPDEAFTVLRETSMRTNRKLRDVAADLVMTVLRETKGPEDRHGDGRR